MLELKRSRSEFAVCPIRPGLPLIAQKQIKEFKPTQEFDYKFLRYRQAVGPPAGPGPALPTPTKY
jgi:hypothetical protein